MTDYDVIIVGGGAAGYTAGIYTSRKKFKTLILSIDVGGQTSMTNHIENYPGVDATAGLTLMKKFEEQATKFGCEIVYTKVTKVDKMGKEFKVVRSDGKEHTARAVILAFGKTPRTLGIPGEEKFMGKGVSTCATCLPPDESVILNSSIKEIKEVNPLNRVLTIDGTYQEIDGFTKRDYSGKLISIKPRFFNEPVLLTPNHPVFSLRITEGNGKNYWRDFKFTEPKWVEASNLTTKDAVLYPIIKEMEDVDSIAVSDYADVNVANGMAIARRATHTSNPIPNEIKVDSDFLRLVGYYLAQGCSHRHMLFFTFRKDENDYINDTKNLLKRMSGLEPVLKEENNVSKISIYSKPLAVLFESLFGKHAHKKQLPYWTILLPQNKQRELIKGMWRGDGSIGYKDFCYVTTSRQLTYQLRDLLLRQGIIPSLQVRKVEALNKNKSEIDGRRIHFRHDKYHILVGGQFLEKMSKILGIDHPKLKTRARICKHARIRDGFAILPIREINTIDYSGKVLNLAIGANNTYVAKNFIVHNCDAPMFKGKEVVVIGGGNSALEAVLDLSKIAKKVYIVHRRDEYRGDEITVEKLKKAENVEEVLSHVPKEVRGDKFVSGLVVESVKDKKQKELVVQGVFLEIGYIVDPTPIKGLVKINEKNEIIVDKNCKTSEEGIFAAGDCTDVPYKQTVISAGEGAKAALECHKYLLGGKVLVVDWS